MGTNPLDPRSLAERQPRDVRRGHGTRELGPSDSSDSGSDVASAGPGIGDANLDSDSDRNGTGERAAAGEDEETGDARDISADHIEQPAVPEEGEDEDND